MADPGKPPLFSIITPVLNAGATLADALQSAAAQVGPSREHLLLDGLSTDDSLEIARRFPHVQIWSEADSGLYEAMNRGAQRASGEWLVFLQADDWLAPGALEAWAGGIQAHPEAVIVSGGAQAMRWAEDGTRILQWARETEADKALDFRLLALGEPMLNARVFRRTWFLDQGGFSLAYQLASDREFLLRAALAGAWHATVRATVYHYRWHAQSRTMNAGQASQQKLTRENLAIADQLLKENPPPPERAILHQWHRQESIRWAMNSLETGSWQELVRAARRGCRHRPLWPLDLLGEILHCVPGWLARGGRTRSQAAAQAETRPNEQAKEFSRQPTRGKIVE